MSYQRVESATLDLGPLSNRSIASQRQRGLDDELIEEMKATATQLASFIPKLREARPAEYEAILADAFTEALQYDDLARRGYIRVLLQGVDHTLLNEYLNNFVARQLEHITKKSAFRVKVEALLEKWSPRIEGKICFLAPEPTTWSERRIQVTRLKASLITIPHGTDHDKITYLYPDDKLASTVEHIVTTGKPSRTSWGFDNGFNGFLEELFIIHQLRCDNKLYTHHDSLTLYDKDKLHIIKALVIGNQNLAQRLASAIENQKRIAFEILNQSEAEATSLLTEIKESRLTVHTLQAQLLEAQADNAQLATLKDDNVKLRREIMKSEILLNELCTRYLSLTHEHQTLINKNNSGINSNKEIGSFFSRSRATQTSAVRDKFGRFFEGSANVHSQSQCAISEQLDLSVSPTKGD